METSENRKVFWCFQEVEKGRIGKNGLKPIKVKFLRHHRGRFRTLSNILHKKWSLRLRFSSVNVAIRSFLQIWSHLLKKSLMENFIFCIVTYMKNLHHRFLTGPEAATRDVLWRKLFLKILQYSQENTCVGVSHVLQSNFIQMTLRHGGSLVNLYSCKFTVYFQNIFS